MARPDEVRSLASDLLQGRLSRRAFVARAVAVGLSGPTIAAALAACGGASPTPTSAPTATRAAAP